MCAAKDSFKCTTHAKNEKVKMGNIRNNRRGERRSHVNPHAAVRLFSLCPNRTLNGLQLCRPVESVGD